jgi:hypothetical protein
VGYGNGSAAWEAYESSVVDIEIFDQHVTVGPSGVESDTTAQPNPGEAVYIVTAYNPGRSLRKRTPHGKRSWPQPSTISESRSGPPLAGIEEMCTLSPASPSAASTWTRRADSGSGSDRMRSSSGRGKPGRSSRAAWPRVHLL